MSDTARGRFTPKSALRGFAHPFVGYFDHRFQDVHDHLDQQVLAAMQERFDQVVAELHTTRSDVAADADTIAELAFTLERFADLFTVRMEELAAALRPGPQVVGSAVVELPFAFAAAAPLEPGASVAAIGGADSLAIGLAALGLEVIALGRGPVAWDHPDVEVVDVPVDEWGGPARPLHALFALSDGDEVAHPSRELVDQFAKWLRPGGFAVAAVGLDPAADAEARLDDLLSDWDVARRQLFAVGPGGVWRRCEPEHNERPGVALVSAVPRA